MRCWTALQGWRIPWTECVAHVLSTAGDRAALLASQSGEQGFWRWPRAFLPLMPAQDISALYGCVQCACTALLHH